MERGEFVFCETADLAHLSDFGRVNVERRIILNCALLTNFRTATRVFRAQSQVDVPCCDYATAQLKSISFLCSLATLFANFMLPLSVKYCFEVSHY
ncbi:MAG: hypothetical protein EAZ30_05205 [Betaproteobacteria bacterium]|nr:MAG: hypothetical protein EAZ43_01235 [Betaproteobacteria bacterium]TAG48570.1 MAG: hypothetical protein EAZ30_05205 [Betaproteobacteria bacterium]